MPLPPGVPPPPLPRSLRDVAQGMVLGGLLVAITIGLGWLLFGRTTRSQVVIHAPTDMPAAPALGAALAAATSLAGPTVTPGPTATPGPVTVFVSGAVVRPGVYTLPGGARVLDALDAAGGSLPTAAAEGINLAVLLRDEVMIYVPLQGDVVSPPTAGASGGTRALDGDWGGAVGPPVNLNSAGADELEALPQIGPAKAAAIIANRPYASVDELERVPGIGPATLAELRPLVTAP